MPNLKVDFTPTTVQEGLEMVADGRIDLFCAAADTLKRREFVSFSIPIATSGRAVLIRKDAPPDLIRALKGEPVHTGPIWRGSINRALAEHTYAVFGGTVSEKWVRDQIRNLGVIATIVTVDDNDKGVKLVADKKPMLIFRTGLSWNTMPPPPRSTKT